MKPITNKVISFGPPKEAALYFDEVLPFDMALGMLATLPHIGKNYESAGINSIPIENSNFRKDVVENLLRRDDAMDLYLEHAALTGSFLFIKILSELKSRGKGDSLPDNVDVITPILEVAGLNAKSIKRSILKSDFEFDKFFENFQNKSVTFINKSDFSGSDNWLPAYTIGNNKTGNIKKYEEILFGATLRGLDLIDVDKISWDHVLEFRKDFESQSSLRDFRIFFSQNFEGLSKQEITDRLHSSIHEYDVTRKAWGFETVKKTFSAAVSQQGIMSSSIGTLSAALLGAGAPIAASVGATVALGSCGLEFGQILVDRWRNENTRPTRFLTQLRALEKK